MKKCVLFSFFVILYVNVVTIENCVSAPDARKVISPQKTGIPIILDTDLDSDVDDVGALAVLHALANRREAKILGVIVTSNDMYSPLCADAITHIFIALTFLSE